MAFNKWRESYLTLDRPAELQGSLANQGFSLKIIFIRSRTYIVIIFLKCMFVGEIAVKMLGSQAKL